MEELYRELSSDTADHNNRHFSEVDITDWSLTR